MLKSQQRLTKCSSPTSATSETDKNPPNRAKRHETTWASEVRTRIHLIFGKHNQSGSSRYFEIIYRSRFADLQRIYSIHKYILWVRFRAMAAERLGGLDQVRIGNTLKLKLNDHNISIVFPLWFIRTSRRARKFIQSYEFVRCWEQYLKRVIWKS